MFSVEWWWGLVTFLSGMGCGGGGGGGYMWREQVMVCHSVRREKFNTEF